MTERENVKQYLRMKLNIPYYSQRTDVKDQEWQPRSCLIMAVKMVAEFLGAEAISADDLIKEGMLIDAWDGKFWKHSEVIRLFRNHGISGYAQEFRAVDVDLETEEMKPAKEESLFLEKGLEKIVKNLDQNVPVIVSIYKYFTEKNRHHAVVIIGYEKEEGKLKGFYYHDPEAPDEKGGQNLFVELEAFKNGWKKLVIFAEKV
jgi:hypothetical protein